jgi:predicted type IV restriction endonuclease
MNLPYMIELQLEIIYPLSTKKKFIRHSYTDTSTENKKEECEIQQKQLVDMKTRNISVYDMRYLRTDLE